MRPVFGIEFSTATQTQLVHTIASVPVPTGTGPRLLVTANLDHVVQLTRNADFREAYNFAWATTADGTPVYLYALIRRVRLPGRVTGAGVFSELMGSIDTTSTKVFFLCSSVATTTKIRAKLVGRGFASINIDFETPPFGFERNVSYSKDLARRIRDHGTTHLVLGVGAPKSEVWAHRYRSELGDCYVLAVGAALDMFVGERWRAPLWVRRIGLEWFWRFVQEPRRLFRRYFVDSWGFIWAIWNDLRSDKISDKIDDIKK